MRILNTASKSLETEGVLQEAHTVHTCCRFRVVVPACQYMQPGGTVRQPYSYLVLIPYWCSKIPAQGTLQAQRFSVPSIEFFIIKRLFLPPSPQTCPSEPDTATIYKPEPESKLIQVLSVHYRQAPLLTKDYSRGYYNKHLFLLASIWSMYEYYIYKWIVLP
jgi:hypothetical protein